MEPKIIDHYNEYPQMIKVIDNLNEENERLKNELEFYKSIFKTHRNSVVYNLYDKYLIKENGEKEKLWIDKIRCDKYDLQFLEQDEDVVEWQKHVRCER